MNFRKYSNQYDLTKQHIQFFLNFLSSRGYSVIATDDYKMLFKVEKDHFVKFLCDINFNSAECSRLLKDKLFTCLALEQLGISIPEGTYFLLGDHQYSNSTEDITEALRQVKYPIIIKPNSSSLGKGITVLRKFSEEYIYNAISKVRPYSDILLVQEYLSGQEYRVIAIEGEIIFTLKKHESPKPPEEVSLIESVGFLDIISRSMKYLGATVCGYDFIVQDESVKVLEINSNPFVFQIKEYLGKLTLERYFLKLEQILRRNYGNTEYSSTGL